MLRSFRDPKGVDWQVWEVPAPDPAQHRGGKYLASELQHGWLRFESASERRRLADYPADWETLPDRALVRLCMRSTVIPSTPDRPHRRYEGPTP